MTTPKDDNGAQKALDRFAAAADNDRMNRRFAEILDEEPFNRFEEYAESLREIADAIETAKDACEEWNDCEDREERANAKEQALDALQTLIDTWNASPLDVSSFVDYDPDEADIELGEEVR